MRGLGPEGHVRFRFRQYDLLLAVGIGIAGLAWRVTPAVAAGSEVGFLAANDAAMNKMMADMAIRPMGDVDRDFVAMMVPHHQGAIDMVQAELRYGHNQTLLRIAQEIVVEQQQEIAAMRLAVGEPASPTWVTKAAKPPAQSRRTRPAVEPVSGGSVFERSQSCHGQNDDCHGGEANGRRRP